VCDICVVVERTECLVQVYKGRRIGVEEEEGRCAGRAIGGGGAQLGWGVNVSTEMVDVVVTEERL